MSEFNWSEHIASARRDIFNDERQQLEKQRQFEAEEAMKHLTLTRMDAVVRSFLRAAGTQSWPGVEHVYKTVGQTAQQVYQGARYTSRQRPEDLYPIGYTDQEGIIVNVNGDWIWQQEGRYYEDRGWLTCTRTDGTLSYDNRTTSYELHPEKTPELVMSVLARIAVDNAIIL